jgi:glutamate formiminotransferase
VIPLVPLGETSLDECVQTSIQLAERIGNELEMPVYLYEHSANLSHRKALPEIRRGGFELLETIELIGDHQPDYGPSHIHPSAGACVVGARGSLIAYNINLRTNDLAIAKKIASAVRERTGGLVGVRALGIALESQEMVQVSMNITRPELVPMHRIFDLVRLEAEAMGVMVAESEVIGALPLKSLVDAARHSLRLTQLHDSQILDLWYPSIETD